MGSVRSLRDNAANAVMGPRRPMNINATRIMRPTSLRRSVVPTLSPTVPKAEITSNAASKNCPLLSACGWADCSNASSKVSETVATAANSMAVTIAVVTASRGIVRRKRLTCSRPRSDAHARSELEDLQDELE